MVKPPSSVKRDYAMVSGWWPPTLSIIAQQWSQSLNPPPTTTKVVYDFHWWWIWGTRAEWLFDDWSISQIVAFLCMCQRHLTETRSMWKNIKTCPFQYTYCSRYSNEKSILQMHNSTCYSISFKDQREEGKGSPPRFPFYSMPIHEWKVEQKTQGSSFHIIMLEILCSTSSSNKNEVGDEDKNLIITLSWENFWSQFNEKMNKVSISREIPEKYLETI